jgi:hypothetical protein
MIAVKPRKPAKSKTPGRNVKDMRPVKDAKGGAQKKEGPIAVPTRTP